MKHIKRKRFIFLFSCLILVAVSCIATSLARYVSSLDVKFNNNGQIDESVDFTVNTVFTVKNQNELFAAINQGYSYIQIDAGLTNPFVLTKSTKELTTDLIIDLNGIELYRHGTDPVFVVDDGTRLTITDTSETQRGCIYNPTGSAIKVTGGTLTVVSGKFECGPRYSEYYTYNENILSDKSHKRTLVNDVASNVDFYSKNAEGDFEKQEVYAPIIKCYNTSYDGGLHHHGNVYFDKVITATAPDSRLSNITIDSDTYCYYTTDEDDSYDLMKLDAEKADWYYTYYVDVNGDYVDRTGESDFAVTEVCIYGYERAIEYAETHDGVKQEDIDKEKNNYFAAIKMDGGLLDVLYGDFFNYFGVYTTACIDMMGGTLRIKEGHFSTRIPNASQHLHHSVDAKEDDAAAFDREKYFNNFYWNYMTEDELNSDPGTRAHKGEGFCILTSGTAKIEIESGNFYASNNNLIHMQNGSLDIGGGTFTKTNTKIFTRYRHTDSSIFMHDGELNIDSANYYIEGDYERAIRMIDGKLTVKDAKMEIFGDYAYAVYSTIPGDDKLNLYNIDFTVQSRTAAGVLVGIYSAPSEEGISGAVNVYSTDGKESHIHVDGNYSAAVFSAGGKVNLDNCHVEIMGKNSAGIYANEGYIRIDGGSINVNSDIGCYGVYAFTANPDKEVNVDVTHTTIDVGYDHENPQPETSFEDNDGKGTAASIGVFLASANENSKINLVNSNIYSYEIGIGLSGGSLVMSDTDTTANFIKTNRASAIAVSGGDLTFAEGGNYEIVSYNTTSKDYDNSYVLTIPYLYNRNGSYSVEPVRYSNRDGVYVSGGSIISHGYVHLTHTGLQNQYLDDDDNTIYSDYTGYVVNSYAIRVVGGNVIFERGDIVANIGGGIYCSATDGENTGTIIMGTPSSSSEDITVTTLGETYSSSKYIWYAIGKDNSTWNSRYSITGGHAIEMNGGDIIIYNGTYTANFSNGVLANGSGVIDIKDGIFRGYMGTGSNSLDDRTGPNAFYGLKVIGGATVRIYGGNFDGGNGGAFVTGADDVRYVSDKYVIGSTTGKMANVLVYGGQFGNANTKFHDGFNVYDYANVVFGAYSQSELQAAADRLGITYSEFIDIYALTANIALNNLTAGDSRMVSNIYIYYGNYSKGTSDSTTSRDGIYFDTNNIHKDTRVYIFNTKSNPKYTVIPDSKAISDAVTAGICIVDSKTSPVFYEEPATTDSTDDINES